MNRLIDAIKKSRAELFGALGAVCVSAGFSLWSFPLGLIVAGGFLLLAAYLDAWASLELPWMKRNVA